MSANLGNPRSRDSELKQKTTGKTAIFGLKFINSFRSFVKTRDYSSV